MHGHYCQQTRNVWNILNRSAEIKSLIIIIIMIVVIVVASKYIAIFNNNTREGNNPIRQLIL